MSRNILRAFPVKRLKPDFACTASLAQNIDRRRTRRQSALATTETDHLGIKAPGRGAGVGRALGVGTDLGVGVGLGVAVGVAVGVTVGVAVGVGEAVGVGVGVAPPVGETRT